MKAVISSLVAVIVIFGSVNSEPKDESPSVIQYPKKVYVDTAKNKVYWPLEKEVFVKLAESSDKSAPSYLLSTEQDSGNGVKGIKLDMSGRQSLRWLNAITKETSHLRFTADGEPPECKIIMNEAPSFINPQPIQMPSDSVTNTKKSSFSPTIQFYGKGLEFGIDCSDKHSGVEGAYLSVNNSGYKRLNGKMALVNENIYDISCFGADKVGNTSEPQKHRFAVDLTAPVSEVIIEGTGKDSICSSSQVMHISSTDKLSGVKESFYRFDDDIKFSVYKNNISLKKLSDGKHTIYFYSSDNVDNTEEVKSLTFSIDDKPPIPDMVYSGDFVGNSGKTKYISSRTQVKVEAKENMSSVSAIEYSIDGAGYKKYTEQFTLPAQDGKRSVSVRATDRSGNVSQIIRTYTYMDTRAPRCKYEITGRQLQKNSSVCITPETKIVFSAHDDASGVKKVEYQIGNDSPVQYSGPLTLDKEGFFIVKYWGTDNVNNVSNAQSIAVAVDKTPPEIVETFSVVDQSQSPNKKFPLSTSLFLAARDNSAGVNGIWYSINGARETKCEGTLKFDKVGKYSLDIRSEDNVGNKSNKVISFTVE